MGLRVVVLLGAIAAWFGAWAVLRAGRPPGASALIAPLLPQAEGQSVCLTGSFTDRVMDVEDWSKAKLEPTKNLSPDGKPYMRPVPSLMKDMSVRSFTLQLVYDTREADYDWIHNFRLLAEVEGVGTMYAAGECPWYAKDKIYGSDKQEIRGNTAGLLCYIDCDGGGFGLERVAGASAMSMTFVRSKDRPQDEGRVRRRRDLPHQARHLGHHLPPADDHRRSLQAPRGMGQPLTPMLSSWALCPRSIHRLAPAFVERWIPMTSTGMMKVATPHACQRRVASPSLY
jgi:hypothetical protein